jgi:AraC family transcriptional regulator
MNGMSSVTVDFGKEKAAGYERVFARLPLLSNAVADWNGVYVAYDYFLPGQTPGVRARQHGLAIFTDLPAPAQSERQIGEQFRCEQVNPGDMVIVPANAWQQTSWNLAGGIIVIGLEPERFAQLAAETVDLNRIELLPHFATSDPLVHQIGLALKRVLEMPGSTSRLYGESMSTALMVHLLQHYSAQQPALPIYAGGLTNPKLKQVIDYIAAHLNQDLSLHQLAAIAQISPHYFLQQFKQSIGITPHQYVIRCRIEQAQGLLKQGKHSISEVAILVGFVDQSHFHHHFKRLIGMTPKTFLRQFKS